MAQYGVKEVADFTIANYVPNLLEREPLISVDYAQVTEIVNGAERTDISGGEGNARLLSFDHSKTVEMNITLPLIDMKMLSIVSGDEITHKIENVFKREIICPSLDEDTGQAFIELKKTPIVSSVYLYKLEGNRDMGTQGKALDTLPSGDIGSEEFYVDTTNKKIIVDKVAFPVGEEVVVYYTTETTKPVEKLRIDPTRFPQTVSIFGLTKFRNQYNEIDEYYNMRIHKARLRPEYTLTMSATDVAVLELTADVYAFREKCKNVDTYIEYIKEEMED